MKKFYLILLSAIFVFSCNIAISQTTNNPFSVKEKKVEKNAVQKVPVSKVEALKVQQSSLNSSQGYNYKSIPFTNPSALDELNFSTVKYEKNGLLMMAESKSGMGVMMDERSEESIVSSAREYLHNIQQAMRINNASEEFISQNIWTDDINHTHIKMQQYFKGVKVDGGQIILHAKSGELYLFNGTYYPTPRISNVTPKIHSSDAESIALADVATFTSIGEMKSFGFKQLEYELAVSELVIYHNDRDVNSEKLAWHITLRPNFLERWEYYVDANTSEVIHKYDATCSDGPATASATDLNGVNRTIDTYQLGSNYYMINTSKPMYNATQSNLPDNPVGAIITLDANFTPYNNLSVDHVTSSNNSWNEASSVSAHYNGSITYDYYLNTHGRNSINGNGGSIFAVVNVNNENGQNLANAYWNGQAMLYGNGGGVFLPLAGGLDVAAHEMTHGVIQNTANLKYEYQSGAINEAMADIAGAMVDRSNWQIGEAIVPANSPYFPTGTLRDMANPHNGGTSFGDNGYQPAHVNEMYNGSDDDGGVHSNSGIINHAYYFLAESIGKDKAERLFYRALANYMTQTSQFIDCRLAFESAAKDLYGNGSTEHNAVSDSFYAVGIGDSGTGGGGGGSAPPGEISVNPGQDYILSYDVNPLDQNTLYISNTQGDDFVPISTTALKRRPSLVDNGSVGVMITENSAMTSIDMNSPYDENIISNDYIWDNVAVSKDGSRIAAITTSIDSAIWVYDFGKAQWAKFHLYSPTFTEGIVMDNVLYADALEWDYTGQYLVYDAYNELKNDDGNNIDYWDVGFIRVWSNAQNNWGDGDIFKLFTGLPEGVSIGNPSLSKNTPFILAFDYVNEYTGDIKIMGANLETGDVGEIFNNDIIGFPNYSKLDNKIVFSTTNLGSEVVGVINLNADKITPSGGGSALINVAKWPVWYATGDRNLMDVEENAIDNNFIMVYPNPVSDMLKFSINTETNEDFQVSVLNIMGQKLIEQEGISETNISEQQIDVSSLKAGTYVIRISVKGNVVNRKFVKAL
ncbi:MAG: neutral protease [Marinilabiliales bacterium]|nr:MAG: neutral protease [Marinilabiliales bacterium]